MSFKDKNMKLEIKKKGENVIETGKITENWSLRGKLGQEVRQ
jgi:DNA-binding XRE family transcriptional regulator